MRLCFYLIEAHFPTYPLQARNTVSDFGALMKSRQTGSFWERNVCPAPHVEPKTIKLAVFHVTIKKADIDRAGKSLVDGGTRSSAPVCAGLSGAKKNITSDSQRSAPKRLHRDALKNFGRIFIGLSRTGFGILPCNDAHCGEPVSSNCTGPNSPDPINGVFAVSLRMFVLVSRCAGGRLASPIMRLGQKFTTSISNLFSPGFTAPVWGLSHPPVQV
jgi:hypothetical protein